MFSQVQIYDDVDTIILMKIHNRKYIHSGLKAGEVFSKATNDKTFFREQIQECNRESLSQNTAVRTSNNILQTPPSHLLLIPLALATFGEVFLTEITHTNFKPTYERTDQFQPRNQNLGGKKKASILMEKMQSTVHITSIPNPSAYILG